jgi:riboflavin-specific deaminase-like protein
MKATARKPPLPFVFVNMAVSADGKIATANRAVSSFGSRRDHDHLLELRATADAVMTGARTADLNPINLGPGPAKYRRMRKQRGLSEYNLRVVVSRSGSLNPNAHIFERKFSPVIVLTTRSAPAAKLDKLRARGAQVHICGEREINFKAALAWLRKVWKVDRLLCEGGGELNDALFRAGVVAELHVTICPKIIGGRQAPTISDGAGVSGLSRACKLRVHNLRQIGEELFAVFRRE